MLKNDSQLDDFFGLKSDIELRPHKESFKELAVKKFKVLNPGQLSQILSKKERYLILSFIIVILGSIITIPFSTFYHFTKTAPDYGGSFSEGVVGEPHYVNPLLSQTNDVDRDLVSLIFSGILKYNKDGKLVPDLAKSYEISSDELSYTVYLKENIKWHDDALLTANDIIFTIQTAQNSDYGSAQRINWQGVEIEKINEYAVMFKLKNKYAQFLNNWTINILPKHIWQDIKPINFALSEFNLKPVGSGPYKFKKLKKDDSGHIQSYELESNKNFYDGRPYINNIKIKFYNSEDEMINSYNKNDISDLSSISPQNLDKIKFKKRLNIRNLKLPRYFAVFLNQNQSKILSDKNVRLAMNYGTNKQEIIEKVLAGNGLPVDSPMIGDIIDIQNNKPYEYNIEQAKKLLADAGWILPAQTDDPDGKGILKKKDDKLSVTLTVPSWPELINSANILKDQWAQIGIEVNIVVLSNPDLQQVIKERNYQMLLFGEILMPDPDPFSLWHSSQKKDPGQNLALYDNKAADTLLEDARQTLNPLERMKKYDDFQKLVMADAPIVLIYNPLYLYGQDQKIMGFDTEIISVPSDKFSNIEKWYIDTKRVLR